jgi:hypothetical protein
MKAALTAFIQDISMIDATKENITDRILEKFYLEDENNCNEGKNGRKNRYIAKVNDNFSNFKDEKNTIQISEWFFYTLFNNEQYVEYLFKPLHVKNVTLKEKLKN